MVKINIPFGNKEKKKLISKVVLPLVLHSFFFFVVLGLELRAYILSHYTSPVLVLFVCLVLVLGFFKIGSQELFAQAGFQVRSS
jgi:hypothetical protein